LFFKKMAPDKDEALFDDLTGGSASQPQPDGSDAASISMLQVMPGDSTSRHVKELIFEYNQHLIQLGISPPSVM
jgi:hypothetical protein